LDAEVESILRELAPRVLGSVARHCHDFGAAEDAVQEALLAAAGQWPRDGVPSSPRAWLIHVASRRLTDHQRSEAARRRREFAEVAHFGYLAPAPERDEPTEEDDTLVLLFMCAHPALTPSSAIALTLRAVGGLTTAEIAGAFLVPEATMAQRISRAKRNIKSSGLGFRLPTIDERAQRLRAVLHVLYLIFNEGYASSAGPQLQRIELSREAIRLTRVAHASLPENPEVAGLLALMLLTDARRLARTGPAGELIPLTEQNRAVWDAAQIAEGVALIAAALAKGSAGPYQVQAAIAAVHDEALRVEDTDWPQILALYEVLEGMSQNPIVALNRAVAAAMVHGPEHGLTLLQALDADPRVAGHYRVDAVRAHLMDMAGDREGAIAHYHLAATRTASMPERMYLATRAARLNANAPCPVSDISLVHPPSGSIAKEVRAGWTVFSSSRGQEDIRELPR
jgi:RNA polymerase sigma factor (sigma-70 family)